MARACASRAGHGQPHHRAADSLDSAIDCDAFEANQIVRELAVIGFPDFDAYFTLRTQSAQQNRLGAFTGSEGPSHLGAADWLVEATVHVETVDNDCPLVRCFPEIRDDHIEMVGAVHLATKQLNDGEVRHGGAVGRRCGRIWQNATIQQRVVLTHRIRKAIAVGVDRVTHEFDFPGTDVGVVVVTVLANGRERVAGGNTIRVAADVAFCVRPAHPVGVVVRIKLGALGATAASACLTFAGARFGLTATCG